MTTPNQNFGMGSKTPTGSLTNNFGSGLSLGDTSLSLTDTPISPYGADSGLNTQTTDWGAVGSNTQAAAGLAQAGVGIAEGIRTGRMADEAYGESIDEIDRASQSSQMDYRDELKNYRLQEDQMKEQMRQSDMNFDLDKVQWEMERILQEGQVVQEAAQRFASNSAASKSKSERIMTYLNKRKGQ